VEFFQAEEWSVGTFLIHDLDPRYASSLAVHTEDRLGARAEAAPGPEPAIGRGDIVVFTTTAGTPYFLDPAALRPEQTILNISLRDLGPQVILAAYNILDDVEHCMKANTAPHLAEQLVHSRDFVTGTLAQLVNGAIRVGDDRPKICNVPEGSRTAPTGFKLLTRQ